MSKSTFRHAGSRTPRGVISYFGAHHAGEPEKYTPRHAAERPTRKGCFPGGDVVSLAAGLTAIAAAAIGATVSALLLMIITARQIRAFSSQRKENLMKVLVRRRNQQDWIVLSISLQKNVE